MSVISYETHIVPPDESSEKYYFGIDLRADFQDIFFDCYDNNEVADLLKLEGIFLPEEGEEDSESGCYYAYFQTEEAVKRFITRLNNFIQKRMDKGDSMGIYEIADEVTEQIKRYYPQSFDAWSKARLVQFDDTEVGTLAELQERRTEFVSMLREQHKAYASRQHEKIQECMLGFRNALADEFFGFLSIPESITHEVYSRANEKGHASGLREVVSEYSDLVEFVTFIVSQMKAHTLPK